MAVEAEGLVAPDTEWRSENSVPHLFQEEQNYPDNAARANFVFMAYPFTPPLPQEEYNAVLKELQTEFPVRLWYFLDEITTQELMRKIWRAILRSDLCIFDTTSGNPNVAFELGLAVAIAKPCITLVKAGESNPLGNADLGYSERAEYNSREALKAKLKQLLIAKSSALRQFNKISYAIQTDPFNITRAQYEQNLIDIAKHVFLHKKITKPQARTIVGNDKRATVALNALRHASVLRVVGAKKGAAWVFTDSWVHHDHEVVGV
jgi:hypothetical protein